MEEEPQSFSRNGQKPPGNEGGEDEEDLMTEDSIVVPKTMTSEMKPVCKGNEKYYTIPFESNKPCTYVKFPFEDQRRRVYNKIMLKKIFKTLVWYSFLVILLPCS